MKYARLVIGYHGCTREVADQLFVGNGTLTPSTNTWDWLGHGIYFWEFGYERALEWARLRSEQPAVIGAIIQLTNCLDLLDIEHTQLLGRAARDLLDGGVTLPPNRGDRREADCFAINHLCTCAIEIGEHFDSVRGSFHEGNAVFPGSAFHHQSHIQVAVRNPAIILGFFKPNDRNAS